MADTSDGRTSEDDESRTAPPFLLSLSAIVLMLILPGTAFVMHAAARSGGGPALPLSRPLLNVLPGPSGEQEDQPASEPHVSKHVITAGSEADRASRQRLKLLTGTWQQEFYGIRTLTILADGTGRMLIRPNGIWAALFGDEIQLDMFWKLDGDRIDYGYSGGRPADKVEAARKSWGDRWLEQIETLNDDVLVLLAADGTTRSVWKRVREPVPAVSSPVRDAGGSPE